MIKRLTLALILFAVPCLAQKALSTPGIPPGLTLSTQGVLSGTPTTVGIYSFCLQVADSATATAQACYTISIEIPLQITTNTLPNGVQGQVYPTTTLGVKGGVAPYTWSVVPTK